MVLGRGRQACRAAFVAVVLVLLVSSIVLANVDESWEWANDAGTGEPRRNLRIFCGDGVTEEWEEWLDEAMANWEDAGVGWTFEVVDEKQNSEITFSVGEVDDPDTLGYFDPQFDDQSGELIGGDLVMNEDVDWDTSGDDTYDPVHTLKHELGHAMRLDHSGNGNVMEDELGAGEHDPTPNDDDLQEARDAAGAAWPEPPPPEENPDGSKRLMATGASLTLPPGFAPAPGLWLQPLAGITLVGPLRVPSDLERVVAAVAVRPASAAFVGPVELRLQVSPGAISGLDLVGETHGHPLPAVDPTKMVAVRYMVDPAVGTGRWERCDATLVAYDASAGTARINIMGGGIYGLAAPLLSQPQAQYARAFPDLPPGPVGDSLVELRALDVYRGYPDGTAGPSRQLTRLEFATIAVRLAGAEEEAEELEHQRPDFEDTIPSWGWGYLNEAVALGLIHGYPDGTFKPQNDVKGVEAAAILLRLLGGYEDATALKGGWPAGYTGAADDIKFFEVLRGILSTSLEGWAESAVSRGEMAVLTCSALWSEWRHDEAGGVVPAQSFLVRAGWWHQPVTVASVTDDGRRWVLRNVARPPGQEAVTRLDVAEDVYGGGGGGGPAGVAAGHSFTAMVQGTTVRAVF